MSDEPVAIPRREALKSVGVAAALPILGQNAARALTEGAQAQDTQGHIRGRAGPLGVAARLGYAGSRCAASSRRSSAPRGR